MNNGIGPIPKDAKFCKIEGCRRLLREENKSGLCHPHLIPHLQKIKGLKND